MVSWFKFYKFVIPEILHNYDIIVFSDSNFIKCCNVSKEKLINYTNDKKDLILVKHPIRTTPQQELKVTLENSRKKGDEDIPNRSGENIKNGTRFLNLIKDIKFNSLLMASALIIHCNKNNNRTNNKMRFWSFKKNKGPVTKINLKYFFSINNITLAIIIKSINGSLKLNEV